MIMTLAWVSSAKARSAATGAMVSLRGWCSPSNSPAQMPVTTDQVSTGRARSSAAPTTTLRAWPSSLVTMLMQGWRARRSFTKRWRSFMG